MSPLRKRWLLLAAALPLLYLPLRAAEPPAADQLPAETADTEEPVPLPPAETQAEEANGTEEASEAGDETAASTSRSASRPAEAGRDEGEQLSLDNNLSFPVDI